MSRADRSCRVLPALSFWARRWRCAGCAGRSSQLLDEARARVEGARADPELVAHARTNSGGRADPGTGAELVPGARPRLRSPSYHGAAGRRSPMPWRTSAPRWRRSTELGRERERLTVDSRDQEIDSWQSQLAELQAQQTDRGLLVTLGDILFDLDRAELNPGGELQVARLADALRQMPDRNLLIEGHTDSSGSDAYNDDLSRRRAEAVEGQLLLQGVDPRGSSRAATASAIRSRPTTARRAGSRTAGSRS